MLIIICHECGAQGSNTRQMWSPDCSFIFQCMVCGSFEKLSLSPQIPQPLAEKSGAVIFDQEELEIINKRLKVKEKLVH